MNIALAMSWNDSKEGRKRAAATLLAALVAVTVLARPALAGGSKTSYDPVPDVGSMYNTTTMVGARAYWDAGYTGAGVDVAIIDTGVAPVEGLDAANKVVNGPDLSFESQATNLRYLDTYGHGTHMAGIIAGRDTFTTRRLSADSTHFLGMAPDARLVNVRVGDSHGAADITQLLAAIDWVVQHRHDNGMNIRVINLSYGTNGGKIGYGAAPLAYAVEVAWRKGIVVVVSAGNDGWSADRLTNPAIDPFVISVGAEDTKGTISPSDDTVATYSNKGSGNRYPDLIAPGSHIQSLRDTNSFIDANFPGGRIDSRFFRGSGTSQAAAVVSGAAALILNQHPNYTPDQVKALLTSTAKPLPKYTGMYQGAGVVNLKAALTAPSVSATQSYSYARGVGTLTDSRGDVTLTQDGVTLNGEVDIFGLPFSTAAWAEAAWTETSWQGGLWMGVPYTGTGFVLDAFNRYSWSGVKWARYSWSGSDWSGVKWARYSWSRYSWSGSDWSENDWSNGWHRYSWSTAAYS